jgi:succinoglycan biosynthesis transport protein ExoP
MIGDSSLDHSGIRFLKRQIEKVEAALALPASPEPEPAKSNSDPYLTELQNERDDVSIQIATVKSLIQKTAGAMVGLEKRIQRTPEREQELGVIERDYDLKKEHFQHLQQKQINAQMSRNLEKLQGIDQFHILDPANFPTKPEGWPRVLFVLGGLAGGVGLGFGLAVFLDFYFPTFRRSVDVELSLGYPLLATIPRFQMAYGKPMKMLSGVVESSMKMNGKADGAGIRDYVDAEGMGKEKSIFQGKQSTNLHVPAQLNLVSMWRPQSMVAEQFRVAATRLDLLGDRPMGNVVLMSSAMQGEGKTSTAANLAYTLARDLDEPTLVIDCDYKRPNLHNLFNLRSSPGVADYLAGQESLESCFQQYADLPLWCLAVGDVETRPVSLAKLQYLSTLIELVRSRYRFIILDGPPILPLADINVLSRLADIVLMVVRSGATPKDVVQKASEMLQTSCPTRMILTDAWPQGAPSYVRHSYSKPKSLPGQI